MYKGKEMNYPKLTLNEQLKKERQRDSSRLPLPVAPEATMDEQATG
jgi:hypothetical protein